MALTSDGADFDLNALKSLSDYGVHYSTQLFSRATLFLQLARLPSGLIRDEGERILYKKPGGGYDSLNAEQKISLAIELGLQYDI